MYRKCSEPAWRRGGSSLSRAYRVQQAKSEELRELEAAKNQLVELQGTMITVSRRFYFDEKLEEIAEKHYDSYQEIIDDYQSLKGFLEYRRRMRSKC